MISKLLPNTIKNILSPHITLEHFGFFSNRRIQDDVAIVQECIHSIKTRKLRSCLMKIDLNRAYDCVDWEFLIMILYKVGFTHRHFQWIKARIYTTYMVVLINGEPTQLFKIHWGLHQGCVLSPLLFILVMDAFGRGIKAMMKVGLTSSCNISRNCILSHILFVDDVLYIGEEKYSKWVSFHKVFENLAKMLVCS